MITRRGHAIMIIHNNNMTYYDNTNDNNNINHYVMTHYDYSLWLLIMITHYDNKEARPWSTCSRGTGRCAPCSSAVHVLIYVCTYTLNRYVCIYIYIYTYVYTVKIHIHTHIHAHVYIVIYIYIYIFLWRSSGRSARISGCSPSSSARGRAPINKV